MTASLAFMASFKDGQGLSDVQEFALGEIGQDKIGQRWSYCLFQRNLVAGQWVADYRNTGVTGGVVAQADASELSLTIGRDALNVAADEMRSEYIVGAYGAAGNIGFVVTGWEALTDSTAKLSVRPLHDADDVVRGNEWPAVPTATTLRLYLPGRIDEDRDRGNALDIRGVVQTDVIATDKNPQYGWVLQEGIGVCLMSAVGGDVTVTQRFLQPESTPAAKYGRFSTEAARGGTTVARILGVPTADELVLAEIQIDNAATAAFGRKPKRPIGAGGPPIR